MKIARRSLGLFAAVLITGLAATAMAEGWSMSNWLPSSKSKKSGTTTTRTQMLDGQPVNRSPGKKTSFVSTVGDGTKKFFSNTKSMFTSKKKTERKSSTRTTGKAAGKKDEPSAFKKWFTPEEPQPAKSIKEFMSLPRNDF